MELPDCARKAVCGKGEKKMTDRDYMLQAIELGKRGTCWTSPNPLVGAVIVKDGRIIGKVIMSGAENFTRSETPLRRHGK